MGVTLQFNYILLTLGSATIVGPTWYLGMNLNPDDGHIMDYTAGWADDVSIGTKENALTRDFLDIDVWNLPVNYIAIVRHQLGVADVVKVFKFTEESRSMLSRFQDMNPGRQIVTEGGPILKSIVSNAQNMADDPIFSVGGDLAFNWAYSYNGARIALTGGRLSGISVDDDNTHGIGNHFACNPLTGENMYPEWAHEISNIQDCPEPTCSTVKLQGTDHGSGWKLTSGPVYGNYALFVSTYPAVLPSSPFPPAGYELEPEITYPVKYDITITLASDSNPGTPEAQFVTIIGTEGATSEHECEADFDQNPEVEVSCVVYDESDIGDYRCVEWRNSGPDGILFTKLKMKINEVQKPTIQKATQNFIQTDEPILNVERSCLNGKISFNTIKSHILAIISMVYFSMTSLAFVYVHDAGI